MASSRDEVDGTMGQDYVYEPLQSGEFRLLHVDSCIDSTLQCRLTTHDIEEAPQWMALSYCWGNGPADVEISLGEKALWINSNLFEALKAYNSLQERQQHRAPIWVDALCICQEDDPEKAVQIPLMRTIYMEALVVFIWQGPLDGPAQLAVDVLSLLIPGDPASLPDLYGALGIPFQMSLVGTERDWLALETKHNVTKENVVALVELIAASIQREGMRTMGKQVDHTKVKAALRHHHLFPADHPFWASWWHLIINEWNMRQWTFQEIQLARHPMLLMCGKAFHWNVVRACQVAWLVDDVSGRVCDPMTISRFQSQSVVSDAVSTFIKSSPPFRCLLSGIGFQWWPLGSALSYTRHRKCSISKDHVYGILGLVSESLRSQITIDYSLKDGDVFTTAFIKALEEKPIMLALLWKTFEGESRALLEMPSWVPDLGGDMPPSSAAFGSVSHAVFLKYVGEALTTVTQTPNSYPLRYDLKFKGVCLDRVARCTKNAVRYFPRLQEMPESNDEFFFLHSTWDWVHEIAGIYGWSSESCFWDTTQPLSRAPDCNWTQFYFHPPVCAEDMKEIARLPAICRRFESVNIRSMWEAQAVLELEDARLQTIRDIMHIFMILHLSTYVFETESGRFGVAPCALDDGDQVLYVPGANSLFALSGEGDRYKGTAYVDGFMGDSLLTLPVDCEWEMFTLTS